MIQWIKHFWHKHRDLSSKPQNAHKRCLPQPLCDSSTPTETQGRDRRGSTSTRNRKKNNKETLSQTSWTKSWPWDGSHDVGGCNLIFKRSECRSPNNSNSCVVTWLSIPLSVPLQPPTSTHSYQLANAPYPWYAVLERARSVMWVILFFPCRWLVFIVVRTLDMRLSVLTDM